MRVFIRRTLVEFWSKHPDVKQSLQSWYAEVTKSKWATPHEVKKLYPSASLIKNNRITFNIKGNSYRLIVKVNYVKEWVFIEFLGTHTEYDKMDINDL